MASEGPSRVHGKIVVEDVDSEDEDVRQSEDVTEMFMTDNGCFLLNREGRKEGEEEEDENGHETDNVSLDSLIFNLNEAELLDENWWKINPSKPVNTGDILFVKLPRSNDAVRSFIRKIKYQG